MLDLVGMAGWGFGAGSGPVSAAVFDAFGADEGIGQRFDFGDFAGGDDDFEAVVMVEVDVQSRENVVMVAVLKFRQLFLELADVVVVNERDGSDHLARGVFGSLADELGADEVAEGLGAVGVTAFGDEGVEFFEEGGIEGDANAAEVGHFSE
jgi:hypothetical protein